MKGYRTRNRMIREFLNDNPGTTVLYALATVTVGCSSYWLYRNIRNYGVEGTLRILWEGDPCTDEERSCLDKIQLIQQKIDTSEAAINILEEGLERAKLDSVDLGDAVDSSMILDSWQKNTSSSDLRSEIGLLSYNLDKIAADIDGLAVLEHNDIRKKKKQLSSVIVAMMDRVDQMIAIFEQLQQSSNSS